MARGSVAVTFVVFFGLFLSATHAIVVIGGEGEPSGCSACVSFDKTLVDTREGGDLVAVVNGVCQFTFPTLGEALMEVPIKFECLYRSRDCFMEEPYFGDPSRIYMCIGGECKKVVTLRGGWAGCYRKRKNLRIQPYYDEKCLEEGCATQLVDSFYAQEVASMFGITLEELLGNACPADGSEREWDVAIDFDTRYGSCASKKKEEEEKKKKATPRDGALPWEAEYDGCAQDQSNPFDQINLECLRNVPVRDGSCLVEPDCGAECQNGGKCVNGFGVARFDEKEEPQRAVEKEGPSPILDIILGDWSSTSQCVCPYGFTGQFCEDGIRTCISSGDPHVSSDFSGSRVYFDFHLTGWHPHFLCTGEDVEIYADTQPWVYTPGPGTVPHVNERMKIVSGMDTYLFERDAASGPCRIKIEKEGSGVETIVPIGTSVLLAGQGSGRQWTVARVSDQNLVLQSTHIWFEVSGYCMTSGGPTQLMMYLSLRVNTKLDTTLCSGICLESSPQGPQEPRAERSFEEATAFCRAKIVGGCPGCFDAEEADLQAQAENCAFDLLAGVGEAMLKKRFDEEDPIIQEILGAVVDQAAGAVAAVSDPQPGTVLAEETCVDEHGNPVGVFDPETGQCVCFEGYIPDPESIGCLEVASSCPDSCNNGVRSGDGCRCICEEGWEGWDCSVPETPCSCTRPACEKVTMVNVEGRNAVFCEFSA